MKRAIIFFTVSIASIAIVLALTYTPETIDALRHFNIAYLGGLVAIWLSSIIGYGLSYFFMARATDSKLGLLQSIQAAFMRILFNLVTPFGFGGGPFIVYYMDQHDVPSGKGTSIIITQMATISVYVLLASALGFFHLYEQLAARPFLLVLFIVTGVIQLGGVIVSALILLYPHAVISAVSAIGRLLSRFKLVKNPGRFKRRVIHDGSMARRSFRRYFTHRPLEFTLGALGIAISYVAEVVMLWLVFRSLGYEIPLLEGLAMSALFYMTLSYMPTPGSSGLGEGVFVALFAGVVPRHSIGIAVILWRVFYSYASSLIGALIASHHFTIVAPQKRELAASRRAERARKRASKRV